MSHTPLSDAAAGNDIVNHRRWIFWACFIALIATSCGFIIRALTIAQWAAEFGLSETQKGEIHGAGLWPFAISIILFSLVIDKVGYGRAMVFAFVCHVGSVILTISAGHLKDPYWGLYFGQFMVALANGTVEAVINPVVTTLYPKAKTKWLNILHAGWPGGMVLGGLILMSMKTGGPVHALVGGELGWRVKVLVLLIPVAIYGAMMLRCRFPVNERVAAGVSYRAMLKELGFCGALIAAGLVVWEVSRVAFNSGWLPAAVTAESLLWWRIGATVVLSLPIGLYTFSLGRGLFVFLTLLMIPLATTELGTDAWIKDLMQPVMEKTFSIDGGWVLIYSATIMMTLRFCAGPIVKMLNPLGMLAMGSLFAAAGLAFLSVANGVVIIVAATVYGIGQTYFWPTTLGVVSERFPRGGALTINTISGVGMLGVGIIGTVLLGNIQDTVIDKQLRKTDAALHAQVVGESKVSIFGSYRPLDAAKVNALESEPAKVVHDIQDGAKKRALLWVAVFPVGMLVCYLALMLGFKARGGYRAEELPVAAAPPASGTG